MCQRYTNRKWDHSCRCCSQLSSLMLFIKYQQSRGQAYSHVPETSQFLYDQQLRWTRLVLASWDECYRVEWTKSAGSYFKNSYEVVFFRSGWKLRRWGKVGRMACRLSAVRACDHVAPDREVFRRKRRWMESWPWTGRRREEEERRISVMGQICKVKWIKRKG